MSGWERLWLFNIRELAEHRVRTVLSVAVVAVAASLLVAVFGISGSITGSVQRFAADVGGNADLEVSGVTDSGFPATLQPEVAKVGGVAAAVPMLRTGLGAPNDPDRMLLIGLDQGANALRSSAIGDSMQAHIGALVRTPNGVLVGAATGYTTGQQIRIGKGSATVAAVVAETRLNGGHFAAAPLPLAQQLAGRPGQLDSILVVAEPGADLDTVRTAIAAAVGGRAVVAAPDLRAAQASTAIQIITVGTLMTASVSLVVAAFLIYTATGMAITQRRPRIAMLRALGGNGRTIVRDLVAEAALLGALGAAVGSVLGIFMGRSALRELPAAVLASVEVRTEYHLPGYAIPVAIALGIGACVAATALAARQVYKVEPVEALVPMEVAGTEVAGGRLRAAGAVLGVALIATAVLTMRLDLGRGALFGLAFSFVGVMLIGFALTTQLVAAAAAIARLFGAPGALAAATVERAPRRVWATLMTVIAAVSLTVVTTASNQNLVDSATTSFDFFADTDLYVSGTGPGVFPTAPLLPENLEAQLAAVPGVERVGPAQMAFATVGTTKREPTFSPASSGRVHILVTASRAELAWIVHMPGSPELSAMSRSRLSAWRTSPTMIRDGRIRRASLTKRRSGTSPRPSRLDWRHCIDTTSRMGIFSSKTSSHVMTRSRGGMAADRQLSRVVLPACVPPATRMLRPAATAACRKTAASRVRVPRRTRSSRWSALTTNLRTLTAQCSRVMSGMTTCNRLPSGSVASTKGDDRSIRRPDDLSIRSTRSRTWSPVSTVLVSSGTPLRATKTWLGALIQISSTSGSSKYCCSGPKPATVSSTSLTARSTLPSGGSPPCVLRSS